MSSETSRLLGSDSAAADVEATDDSTMSKGPNASTPEMLWSNLLGSPAVLLAQAGLAMTFVTLWTILYRHPSGLFTYHPVLQSIAVIGFLQGVLLLQPPPKDLARKSQGLKLHQVFQLTSLPVIVAGAAVIIYNKVLNHGKHFYTWHGWFGLATLFLIVLQITFGAVIVFSPLTKAVGGPGRAKALWKYHRMSGYVTILLLLVTPLLAVDSDWVRMNSNKGERVVMSIGIALALLGTAVRVRTQKLGFKKT